MTAGPGDEMAAGAAGRGHLGASRADREQVIALLKAAFVQGRLTKYELDARVGHDRRSRRRRTARASAVRPAGTRR